MDMSKRNRRKIKIMATALMKFIAWNIMLDLWLNGDGEKHGEDHWHWRHFFQDQK